MGRLKKHGIFCISLAFLGHDRNRAPQTNEHTVQTHWKKAASILHLCVAQLAIFSILHRSCYICNRERARATFTRPNPQCRRASGWASLLAPKRISLAQKVVWRRAGRYPRRDEGAVATQRGRACGVTMLHWERALRQRNVKINGENESDK